MIDYVCVYIYMCIHCIYYHYVIMIHHHTPTSCPFSLVARYGLHQGAIRILRLVGAWRSWSLQTCQRRWVGWSYGLSHMACTLKGLEKINETHLIVSICFDPLSPFWSGCKRKPKPVSWLSLWWWGADIASWLKRFSFAMDSCAKRGKLQDHSLRSCFDLQNWTHSTRGSWMMSV